MNPALLLSLIEIATKAAASIAQIKADYPEVYAQVSQQVGDALARAEAAANLP
jgi:hypothetical protein